MSNRLASHSQPSYDDTNVCYSVIFFFGGDIQFPLHMLICYLSQHGPCCSMGFVVEEGIGDSLFVGFELLATTGEN